MRKSTLRDKSKEFAHKIISSCRDMRRNGVEHVLVNQLLKCGTSIGANVHEAQYAQSTPDFISKFEIALKECNECDYWLDLLHEAKSINPDDFSYFKNTCVDMRRMLVASITTKKKNLEQEKQDSGKPEQAHSLR